MAREVKYMTHEERTGFVQPEKGKVQERSYRCLQLSDWKMQRRWRQILPGGAQW